MGCENPTMDEREGFCCAVASGLGCAAAPKLKFYREILEVYEKSSFLNEDGSLNLYTIVERTTDLLKKYGLKNTMEIQDVAEIKIYPAEYFCPIDMRNGKLIITDKTHSIHRYASSWESKYNIIRGKIYRFISRSFGEEVAKVFKRVFGRK